MSSLRHQRAAVPRLPSVRHPEHYYAEQHLYRGEHLAIVLSLRWAYNISWACHVHNWSRRPSCKSSYAAITYVHHIKKCRSVGGGGVGGLPDAIMGVIWIWRT